MLPVLLVLLLLLLLLSTTTTTKYYYYFRLTAFLQVNPAVGSAGFLSFTCCGTETPIEISRTGFYWPICLILPLNHQCQRTKEDKALTLTSGPASSFLHLQPDS